MSAVHPNIAVILAVDPTDMARRASVFAEDAAWHFITPKLPDVEGDYRRFEAICGVFQTMRALTGGTFRVNVIDARPNVRDIPAVFTKTP